MQCVITGCALVFDQGWVAGDLFDAGEYWVFHGNVKKMSTTVEWHSMPVEYDKTLHPTDWWERRGVFVIAKSKCALSVPAQKYISTWSH